MKKGRRQFLRECSLTMLAVSFGPGILSGKPWLRHMKTVPVEELHHSTFAGHLNSVFQVECGQGQPRVDLELIEASQREERTTRDRSGGSLRGEAFSLLFRGPASCLLGQGCHKFRHPQIGCFEMFITPVVSLNPDHITYEAVFNRLLPHAAESPTRNLV